MNTATKLIGICIGVGLVILILLLILAVRAFYCHKAPDRRHGWQNTGMADRYNRHVYLCRFCHRTQNWYMAPRQRVTAPEPNTDL